MAHTCGCAGAGRAAARGLLAPETERPYDWCSMTYMHASAQPRRSAFSRLALLLAAVAQLAVAFLAPAAEARADRDTRAHVEVAGTRLHHAHVELLCPACSSQLLLSVPPSGRA